MRLYLILAFAGAIAFFITGNQMAAMSRRIDLLEARVLCVNDQMLPLIEEYDRRKEGTWPAAVDSPSTYCDYLANEHPDLLLKYGQ
jgi:hypothetical protein